MQQKNVTSISILLFLSIAGTLPITTYAQGCSDAGFCSVGALKPASTSEQQKSGPQHRLSLLSSAGQGDDGVWVYTPGVQYDYIAVSGWNLQAKVTGNYANGSLGSHVGAGDVFLSATKPAQVSNQWTIAYTAGLKIPLGTANASEGGFPLPMQYQSTLGTLDAIAGITLASPHWQFSAGYQQPLTGANQNGFLPAFWNGKPEANNYPSTFQLNRKADALVRAVKRFGAGKKFTWNLGVLAILHLGEDRFTNPLEGNQSMFIQGSSGLTLNLTGAAFYKISKKAVIGLSAGGPQVVRDVRPDGLTRRWVIAPEISWSF